MANKLIVVLLIAIVVAGGAFLLSKTGRNAGKLVWKDVTPAQIKAAPNPHNYEGAPMCPACHTGPNSTKLIAGPIATCERCHAFAHQNHPVNVTQPTPVTTVPMGPGNLVLCHTCHEEHDMSKFPNGLRMEFTTLCLQCHKMH